MANNEIIQVVVNGNTYNLVGQDVNLATIETDASSASKSYAVGDHLVVGNTYCKVIAAISAGDALVIGSNIESAKVGNEINQLNNDLIDVNASLSDIQERVSKMGMKVLKYGTIKATSTIQLGVTLDPTKYMVNINTSGYRSKDNNVGTDSTHTYTWTDYGQGAYLSDKTSTSCTITVSSGITASYEIIQIAE